MLLNFSIVTLTIFLFLCCCCCCFCLHYVNLAPYMSLSFMRVFNYTFLYLFCHGMSYVKISYEADDTINDFIIMSFSVWLDAYHQSIFWSWSVPHHYIEYGRSIGEYFIYKFFSILLGSCCISITASYATTRTNLSAPSTNPTTRLDLLS